ncbi:general secretion pathway protein GspK [Desulfococcaceae bacterium HSG8]|nr:general secretion pathway protein GspK [Desulfococcaceae bacterium HSG8]
MMLSVIKNRRGVALLITVTITTILIAAALELNRKVRISVTAIATTRDRFTLSHMATAGVHAAMAMLVKDKMSTPAGTDSVQEDWSDPEEISEVLQAITFEKGRVTFSITDELGKIQANALVDFPKGRGFKKFQQSIWDNLIRPVISQDEDIKDINATTDIINSVKDWLDSGDDDAITGVNGAESNYYQGLDPPYSCRNGPFTHTDELAMVKGIAPELIYGKGETAGISKYMTIYGISATPKKIDKKSFTYDGKININTADIPILEAIIGEENKECAQAMFDYRKEREETSESKSYVNRLPRNWYKNVTGCSDIKIVPEVIRYNSDLFRIESTATLYDNKLVITAVVKRERDKKTRKWKCRVLSWQTG